jgi:hypothetical protein
MKKLNFIFIGILVLSAFNCLLAQGEAAIPFLAIPISPAQNAMGATGTSLPTDDVYGFLFNPAQLGYTSQSNNLSFIFYPNNIKWANFNQVSLTGMGLNLGYNFKSLLNFPLSVGIGFANPELNFGEFVITDPGSPEPIGTFGSKDYYYAYSMGAGIDYYVQFYAGITYKSITSILSDAPNGEEQGSGTAEVSAIDYGFLLNIPVIRLIDENLDFNIIQNVPTKPYLNLSFGLAKSNIGDEVFYIDPAQADPLPRTARLGYGVSTGINMQFEKFILKAFDIAFTVDADDILIERDSLGSSYQSGLGDIDFSKNIIQIEGDDHVVSHAGLQISLFETLVLRNGHFSGRRTGETKTKGIEIRTKGLLKLLEELSDSPTIKFISNHFDLRYYNTNYFSDHPLETKMNGIALVISGFEF